MHTALPSFALQALSMVHCSDGAPLSVANCNTDACEQRGKHNCTQQHAAILQASVTRLPVPVQGT
ncbi:MAG: hypothetical protein ACK56I_31355, partial [bacterium]